MFSTWEIRRSAGLKTDQAKTEYSQRREKEEDVRRGIGKERRGKGNRVVGNGLVYVEL